MISNEISFIFRPQSIAVVGVSSDMNQVNPGRRFVRALQSCGYKGKIFPVGLNGTEIFGLKMYPDIKVIPENVDYVISAIPAEHVSRLIHDSAGKGAKAVHLFTAGFSETESEEEKKRESDVVACARQAGIRILGPNCMGLYCPSNGISFDPEFSAQSGDVGLICQSGGNTEYLLHAGPERGIYFSKGISYGNASDLNETDFLEYLSDDPETNVILGYIEGVKDGRRFFETLKRAASRKPVIIYKAGATEEGARAAASHTGSLAGSDAVWRGMLKQCGAVGVESAEELLDMALLFRYLSPPRGNRVAIMGEGGGVCVYAADECAKAGLTVPRFPPEVRERLIRLRGTEAGCSFKNPVDTFPGMKREFVREAIRVIAGSGCADILIFQVEFSWVSDDYIKVINSHIEAVMSLAEEINKFTVIILQHIPKLKGQKAAAEITPSLYKAGIPVFPSVSGAARAVGRFVKYYGYKQTP